MIEKRFDPKNIHKLNNPQRLKALPPDVIIEKSEINNPQVIIDVGAGSGFFSVPFVEKFPASKLYACDISEVMLAYIEKNVSSKYDNIVPVKMDDSSIPLDSGIADFLFMINLQHELDNPLKTLKECNRLLKSGSKIAISDWKKEISENGPPFEIRIKPEEIEKHLCEAGFVKIRIYHEFHNNYLIIAEKP